MKLSSILLVLVPFVSLAAIGCSHNKEKEENEQVVAMDQVPPAAREALKREAQGAPITKIDKEMSGGKEVYETDVMINGKNWEIKVDAAGNVVSKKLDPEEGEKNEKKNK
jgi:uncharacterized membrane protein YkoI